MKQIVFITAVTLMFCGCPKRPYAQDLEGLTGPAYAAAMNERLHRLQERNAARAATAPAPTRRVKEPARAVQRPVLTGPAYAAARSQMLYQWQRRNAATGFHGQGLTGPYYAAYEANVKANQRLWNGTWPNNFYYPYYTPPRKPGSVSRLNDPWLWYSQQPYGWFQWRY